MARKPELPRFIPPMLASPGAAFDSPDYLFEVKWDGTRALAFIEATGYRLLNRRRIDMEDRYPEFAFLRDLPQGCVLDGEVVVLRGGKPDFSLLQSREQARSSLRIRSLARTVPATYIVFDLLYENYQSVMAEPLRDRRELLRALVKKAANPHLILSEGVEAKGKSFFAQVSKQGLEGMIAKRLGSKYLPGKRTDAWIKVKKQEELLCAIMGFLPSGVDDFQSLILAAHEEDSFRCVGKVGTGFNAAMRRRLNSLLWSRLVPKPWVSCKIRGKWVSPGLFCRVRFMERTSGGELRAPSFQGLLEG